MAHDVFICHSSKDRTIANAICSALEQEHIRCWIAPRDVLPGRDYAEAIIEAISGATLTVLVFSESSNRSLHVHREIERTVGHGLPILPFRVDDVVPSPSLEYFISNAHWLDAMTPPMEQHLQHLVGTVRLLLDRAGTTVPAAPATPSTAPPPAPRAGALPTWWRWAALGAVALVGAGALGAVVLASGGGSGGKGSSGTTSPPPRSSGPTTSPTASTTTARDRLGTPVSLTGMDSGSRASVTVVRIVDPTTGEPGVDTPAPGNRYLAVQLQIQNTGTTTYDDTPDNCVTIVDAAGRSFEATTVYSASAGPVFPSSVTLRPGQRTTGYTVFEVPTGSKVATVRFVMDSGYADDAGVWSVR